MLIIKKKKKHFIYGIKIVAVVDLFLYNNIEKESVSSMQVEQNPN